MPIARLRCSGGTTRLTAPSTTANVVPLSPSPSSTPTLRYSARGRRGDRHQHEAGDVERRPADHDLRRTEPVGEHAGHRLRGAPDEVLEGDREREDLAPPAELEAHRLEEEAEAVADAERDREHGRGGGEHYGGGSASASLALPFSRGDRLHAAERLLDPDEPGIGVVLEREAELRREREHRAVGGDDERPAPPRCRSSPRARGAGRSAARRAPAAATRRRRRGRARRTADRRPRAGRCRRCAAASSPATATSPSPAGPSTARHPLELRRRELAHRAEEAVAARLRRELADELLHERRVGRAHRPHERAPAVAGGDRRGSEGRHG